MAFEREVVVHRPNALLRALAAAPFVATLLAVVLFAMGRIPRDAALPIGIEGLAFGLVLSSFVRRRNPWAKKERARLAADAHGVSLDGARALARADIHRGYVQPWSGKPPTVRLVDRLGLPRLEVEVANEEEGRALLETLELGVTHQATRFRGASPLVTSTERRLAFGFGLAIVIMLLSWFASRLEAPWLMRFAPFLALGTIPLAIPAWIEIGADGVLVRWLWTRRFVAYADIAGCQAYEKGVRLWLHSGHAVDLAVIRRRRSALRTDADRLRRDAVLARIQEGLAAAREGRGALDVAALVARGGRKADEWLAAVHRILGGDGGDYRVAAVPPERLWRVAEDPTAEETARVGAAVALRTRLDENGRARLLRVAEASVSPKVRVALRAAASAEDDAALVEALAAYEAEGARS